MGYSSTTADDLRARSAYRAASGTSFSHTASMHSTPAHARTIHESLDPKRVNSVGDRIRECLDSAEHPLTLPVVCLFDETGSMGHGAYVIQEKLALLKGLTLRAGLNDVQLCFGAYGDAMNGEVAPCQIGQFESGLEMEEWLNNIYIEGNGGGNNGETASLALWWLGNHSKLDSFDKRGKKGLIFLTGDEVALPITKEVVKHYTDDDIENSILTPEECVAAASKMYDIYFLLVNNGAAKHQGSLAFWSKLLGESNVVVLENLDNVSEVISGIIAYESGAITSVDDMTTLLSSEGASSAAIELVSKTLATRTASTAVTSVVTTSDGSIPSSGSTADFI